MADSAEHSSAVVEALTAGLSRNIDGCLVDFRIKCDNREWNVHKIVLSINSPVLGAACTRDFKEANQGYIDLSEDGEKCVEALISYLYTFRYDPGLASNDLCFHVRMCVIADKYDIPPLKSFAARSFKQSKDISIDNREGFCQILRYVYDNPEATKDVREHMINLIIESNTMAYVLKNKDTSLELAMRDYADLATDVAMALESKRTSNTSTTATTLFSCPSCTSVFGRAVSKLGLTCYIACYRCGTTKQLGQWRSFVIG